MRAKARLGTHTRETGRECVPCVREGSASESERDRDDGRKTQAEAQNEGNEGGGVVFCSGELRGRRRDGTAGKEGG